MAVLSFLHFAADEVCPEPWLPGGLCSNPRRHHAFNKLILYPLCPASPGPKTYAAWQVWRDSTTSDLKFQAMPKRPWSCPAPPALLL
jgi:hypothetical protein